MRLQAEVKWFSPSVGEANRRDPSVITADAVTGRIDGTGEDRVPQEATLTIMEFIHGGVVFECLSCPRKPQSLPTLRKHSSLLHQELVLELECLRNVSEG
ncbi:hypothetical protein KM043_012630 [Ampulex compressa]|nr:hypothetical protein KM043_012630 [Ampulex compressa]